MTQPAIQKYCANCGKNFSITERDSRYYHAAGVPHPTWCPLCRHVRRHGFINDYVFYTRTCDCCKKQFISIFPPKSAYVVYCQHCWYSDARDDKAHARDYDLSRTFFEQFDDLMHAAPQLGIIGSHNENCDYCESVANCKNCYLISESSNCEDCLYCYWIQLTKDCLDCCYTHECERCYGVSDCFNCYGLCYSQNCAGCSDSFFLDNCVSCKNCFFCANLRHKEYHINNKPYTKEQYLAEVRRLLVNNWPAREELRQEFRRFLYGQPRKHLQVENIENCTGNYIRNAKNCFHVFHCYDAEDCAYGEHVWRGARDCYDANTAGRQAELIYESTNCGIGTYNIKFCRYCWSSRDIEYCNQCQGGSNLFGCVSLKPGSKYCILNKQYSEDDYYTLLAEIKKRMLADSEYGEFFPLSISLFGYNNSVSFDEVQYSEKDVRAKGWKWETQLSGTRGKGTIQFTQIPDDISKISDALAKEVLTCSSCEKNYRIIAHELNFYRKLGQPIPRQCPDCRQRARLAERQRKVFSEIACAKCSAPIITALDPAHYSQILCDGCYCELVY